MGALQEKIARDIRETLMMSLQKMPLQDGLSQAFATMSSRENVRGMAWLIARGRSPFPPAEEQGLRQIQQVLHQKTGRDEKELGNMILLILFAMYGEGMFGEELRTRLGIEHSPQSQKKFQKWLLSLFAPK